MMLPPHRAHSLCSLLAFGMAWFISQGMAEESVQWRQAVWNGEKAWESTSAGWVATVSEERVRLVSLSPVNGQNILYINSKDESSWGGHRVWLGPQAKWFSGWPPPADWESSRCAEVKASGNRLELVHQHSDGRYPQLERAYFWSDGVLHCEVRWQGEGYHAIQILQLPRGAMVHVSRLVREGIPKGYALLPIYGRQETHDGEIEPGVSQLDGDRLTLWHANLSEKIAVFPQEIEAKFGPYQLVMRQGRSSGISSNAPDRGLLTQVYLGDWENPYIEIEQLSAYGGTTPSLFEILIEPRCLK